MKNHIKLQLQRYAMRQRFIVRDYEPHRYRDYSLAQLFESELAYTH